MADLVARGVNGGSMALYVQEQVQDPITGVISDAPGTFELYVGGTSSSSLSIDRGTIETTNKDKDSAQYIPSYMNWNISFDGFVTFTADGAGEAGTSGYTNFIGLYDLMACSQIIKVKFREITQRPDTNGNAVCAAGIGNTDNQEGAYTYLWGYAYITSLEESAASGEAVTMSGELQGTGDLFKQIPA